MCGRFALATPVTKIAALTQSDSRQLELEPVWNIAPSANILAVHEQSGRARECALMSWGFIPHWAKDSKFRPINARGETVSSKPYFRGAFQHGRCLVFADGFYEWQQHEQGKQPYYICLTTQQPFAIAGIWDNYGENKTVALITTSANSLMQPIHPRMPVIIDPIDWDNWLGSNTPVSRLNSLLTPYPAEKLMAYPVSTEVNKPGNNDKSLTAKLPGIA